MSLMDKAVRTGQALAEPHKDQGVTDPKDRTAKKSLVLPTILLVVGGISYGSLPSANKIAVDSGFPFISYAFWQILTAAMLLLIGSAVFSKLPRLNATNLRVFALVAVAGVLGPLLALVTVADKLSPGVLTLIIALIPAATYMLAVAIRTEKLLVLSVGGVLLGFGAILMIILPTESLPIAGLAWWVVFALLVPASAAVNNVFGALMSPADASAVSLAAGAMSIAAILLFFTMLGYDGLVLPTDVAADGAWAMVWAGASQAITYSCFFEIVRRAGGLFFAQMNYVVVAAGLFWASIIFDDPLSHWVWGAVALLVGSIALINAGAARRLRGSRATSG